MKTNISKYKKDIKALIREGESLLKLLNKDIDELTHFRKEYEQWYTEALYLVKQIIPERENDLKEYYDSRSKDSLKTAINYTPGEKGMEFGTELSGSPPSQVEIARSLFTNQLAIVKSAERKFTSSLFDIRALVQADLFDSEIEVASELNKKGFVRGAGAILGVVLEGHLNQICIDYKIAVTKKHPSINDYNQILKDKDIIDTKTWRFIQHLADIRNDCDHKKDNIPEKTDISEMIKGVEKVIKTVF